jgi:hypothetical protein
MLREVSLKGLLSSRTYNAPVDLSRTHNSLTYPEKRASSRQNDVDRILAALHPNDLLVQ